MIHRITTYSVDILESPVRCDSCFLLLQPLSGSTVYSFAVRAVRSSAHFFDYSDSLLKKQNHMDDFIWHKWGRFRPSLLGDSDTSRSS